MEHLLGVTLLERTTRSVRMTPAGEFLFRESQRMVGDVASTLKRLREEFGETVGEIRVGVSRQIAHAHLPGLFHRQSTNADERTIRISRDSEINLLQQVESHDIDLAIMDAPSRLPRSLTATHRFEDPFTVISEAGTSRFGSEHVQRKPFQKWAADQRWILPPEECVLGRNVRRWLTALGVEAESFMEIDDLDLIVHTVAMGFGVALVPIRCMSTFRRKQNLTRINLKARFTRDLVVVVRKHRKMPGYLAEFLGNLLF